MAADRSVVRFQIFTEVDIATRNTIDSPFGDGWCVNTINRMRKIKLYQTVENGSKKFTVIFDRNEIGFDPANEKELFSSTVQEEADFFFSAMCENISENAHFYECFIVRENFNYLLSGDSSEIVAKFVIFALNQFMPLGVPYLSQLAAARDALNRIQSSIDQHLNEQDIFLEASNKFYAMIPHVGIGKLPKDENTHNVRPVIKTIDSLNMENQLVNQIETVLKALEEHDNLNNFCINYLEIQLTPIDRNEHEAFLSQFGLDKDDINRIKCVLKVNKPIWDTNYRSDIANEHYLFHSIDPQNVIEILKNGLVPISAHFHYTTRWLGHGIYFSGSVKPIMSTSEAMCILVCRVALGEIKTLEILKYNEKSDYWYPLEKFGKNSLWQKGDSYKTQYTVNETLNAKVLSLRTKKKPDQEDHKWRPDDEFLVQNGNQVKIEYIIQLNEIESPQYTISSDSLPRSGV